MLFVVVLQLVVQSGGSTVTGEASGADGPSTGGSASGGGTAA